VKNLELQVLQLQSERAEDRRRIEYLDREVRELWGKLQPLLFESAQRKDRERRGW
jgi:hypothetical protein